MKYFISIVCTILFLANCVNPPQNNKSINTSDKSESIKAGQKIAETTFATLAGNLQKAMKEGGVANAVSYCNLAASPLVDSLEQLHNATIKRTSLKVRNTNNKPTTHELKQLNAYQKQSDSGEKLKPVVEDVNGQTMFYAPIHVASLCLKCHGEIGDQLLENDYETIQKLYPADQAVNYKDGDLRGMWSIRVK